jgi:hypothetical protein
MKVSKALVLAMTKVEEFTQIYEATKDEDIWRQIELPGEEKLKIESVVQAVDDHVKNILSGSMFLLKQEVSSKYNGGVENRIICNYGNSYANLHIKVSSKKEKDSFSWFEVYFDVTEPKGPWGIHMAISFTQLSKLRDFDCLSDLEKELCSILGKKWITSEQKIKQIKDIGNKIDDGEDFKGCVYYDEVIPISVEMQIKELQNKIINIGKEHFVQRIGKLKKFRNKRLRNN